MTGSEDPDWSEQWDDVVDVICVGSAPGVLAYLNACVAADLDVLHAVQPDEFDSETQSYLAAMTEDLGPGPQETETVVTRAVAAPLRRDTRGRPDTLDPFFGAQLREWSARCAHSPFGVLFTQVPDQFIRMRTENGDIITAVTIPDIADTDSATETFAGFVHEDGRIAGAVLTGRSGSRRVRADTGLVLPVGPSGGQWPPHDCTALVSRPAGRFARLEVVLPGSDDDV